MRLFDVSCMEDEQARLTPQCAAVEGTVALLEHQVDAARCKAGALVSLPDELEVEKLLVELHRLVEVVDRQPQLVDRRLDARRVGAHEQVVVPARVREERSIGAPLHDTEVPHARLHAARPIDRDHRHESVRRVVRELAFRREVEREDHVAGVVLHGPVPVVRQVRLDLDHGKLHDRLEQLALLREVVNVDEDVQQG